MNGAHSNPHTWWIGIIQLQMQTGRWGRKQKASAQIRSSIFWQASNPIRKALNNPVRVEPAANVSVDLADKSISATPSAVVSSPEKSLIGNTVPPEAIESPTLFEVIARYNLAYRKADISGRVLGGFFTNYATMGGRMGSRQVSTRASLLTATPINFVVASYGAAIQSIARGMKSPEEILQAVITGKPEKISGVHKSFGTDPITDEESNLIYALRGAASGACSLCEIVPSSIPIREFCSRPENINLTSICR